MRKLTAVIVEDEHKASELLENLLIQNFHNLIIKGMARNAADAFRLISGIEPDIVFMDIRLGQETGFDILKRFEGINFQLIFTTAFSEYAVKAFDYPSPQFLTKPIQLDKLSRVIDRVEKNVYSKILNESQTSYNNHKSPGKLAFSSSSSTELIDLDQIEFLSAEGSYTALNLTDGTKRISSKILGHYEKCLNDNRFFRIHRKYIVNLDHIVKYDKSKSVNLYLTSGKQIQSSVVYKSKLLSKLKDQVTY